MGAPDIIVRNEKRMLQESVDALIDNGRRGRPVTGAGGRQLKSLSDLPARQAGPLPPEPSGQARGLFGPLGYRRRPDAQALPVRSAQGDGAGTVQALRYRAAGQPGHGRERQDRQARRGAPAPRVWDVLESVIKDHPVMLNRARRCTAWAFRPSSDPGRGQGAEAAPPVLHPPSTPTSTATRCAVHVPLSMEAQAEARFLMLSANNILKPQDGKPSSPRRRIWFWAATT